MKRSGKSLEVPKLWYFTTWWRWLIPSVMIFILFLTFCIQSPTSWASWFVCLVPSMFICMLLLRGLTISQEGIAWYWIRPNWRYRIVPWKAVRKVKRTFGILDPLRIEVEDGIYEPWLWGRPIPDRSHMIELWTNNYACGETIFQKMEEYWLIHRS